MTNIEEYLERIPMWASRKNSLDNVRDFLEELGNPDREMRILHVAGTNGKGSVCQYLTSVLCQAGFRVGTFVSPHLETIRERFLMDGNPVDQDGFEEAFWQVRSLADRMAGRGYAPPTYFEFLFYMFLVMMKRATPDFVVLETGLGGRLDVTNVVNVPILTILTSISMDHMQYLGDTLEKIAAEKAGIFKKNVPVIYDDSCLEGRGIIEKRAEALGCPRFPIGSKDYVFVRREEEKTLIQMDTGIWGRLLIGIPSQAEYQMMNAAVAVRALDVLVQELWRKDSDGLETQGEPEVLGQQKQWRKNSGGLETQKEPEVLVQKFCRRASFVQETSDGLTKDDWTGKSDSSRKELEDLLEAWIKDGGAGIIQGIQRSYWPGRMEQVLEGVYLDGAHNVGGVEALNRTIRRMQEETKKPVSIMFGAVSDKDHRQMIRRLCDRISIAQVTIAHMDTKRSAGCRELEEEFKQIINCPIKVFPEVGQAWEYFLRTRKDSLAFCAGSLYLVGEVKGFLGKSRAPGFVEAVGFKGGTDR